jgi:hypothetical protein
MKVHTGTGRVEFERGAIDPGIDRRTFLRSALGRDAEVFLDNEPHVTYRIRPEPGVTATLYFEGPILRSLSWLFDLPAEQEDDWSEALELRRKKLHDDWLRQQLGAEPYRYGWGELLSEYDSKGCVSDIILNYAR